MKIIALSDNHGYLPEINEAFDVLVVSGDIVDLYYQTSTIKSIVWFTREFVPWAMNLDCKRVIIIAGNHDFFFQRMVNDYFKTSNIEYTREEIERHSADVVKELLLLPSKIVYLQDSEYTFMGKKFYGTPWCPDLQRWAFYKNHDDLVNVYDKIPDNVDVLITHTPGKYVNDTGVSLGRFDRPEYGSAELTDAVKIKKPKYWFVGHVHSGNHNMTDFFDTKVVNVSIKDEGYSPVYGYKMYEI